MSTLATKIAQFRMDAAMTQEQLAARLNVSRQAVQKWESGAARPDLSNLIAMSSLFAVSLDMLVFDSDTRIVEELKNERAFTPEFSAMHAWELYCEQLPTEFRQCVEEGLDVEPLRDLFTAVARLPRSADKRAMADILFNMVRRAPMRADYPYTEPSDLDGIRAASAGGAVTPVAADDALRDRIAGAWYGRIVGCLLGKPVEGIRTDELLPLLKASGNYPMHRYIVSGDVPSHMYTTYRFKLAGRCFADTVDCMPVDDDTNYTVLGQMLIDKHGHDFTPTQVAKLWLDKQPKNAYCTAERVAFVNFVNGYLPPDSAEYQNPFREWVGAQIRADYFGYITPGDPAMAAEMAWRDASISHIKNGIYGEMFVAAMLAEAAVTDDIPAIIRAGLAQIPTASRLHERITAILADRAAGVSEADVFADIHRRWDEHNAHDWCHTISNAEIVTASLLWCGGDFGRAICRAVETGFDTDCNGATVGSILGMRGGMGAIGEAWLAPLHGTLNTSIFGVGRVSIDTLIDKTMRHIQEK